MPMRPPGRLSVLVGAAVAGATACLLAAGAAAIRSPLPSPLTLLGCVGLIWLGTRLNLRFRLGAQRVQLTWSEAGIILSFALAPAAWVVLLTPVAVLVRFVGRQPAIKITYNVANYTIASAASAAVVGALQITRPVGGTRELVVIAAAGSLSGLITYGAVAAVIATVQDVPLLSTWRASAGLQFRTLAGNIAMAIGVLVAAEHDIRLALAVPVVAFCLHLGYEGRLRGHQERAAGELHAAAIGAVTLDLDEPSVALRAAEQALKLAAGDAAEVEILPGHGRTPMLYRANRVGEAWSGPSQDAPPVAAQMVAELTLRTATEDPAGFLRIWLASNAADLALEDGANNALKSLAAHTAAALANARAHAHQTYFAWHDQLTGLPNRAAFLHRVNELVDGRANGTRADALAMALFDISGYRDIVKALGHDVAEWLLAYAAGQLRAAARPPELVAHIGADHFAVLLPAPAGPAEVRERVETLLAAIETPVRLDVGMVELNATAGIVYTTNPGRDGVELLRQAAVGLDEARRAPYVPVEFYDPAVDMVGSPAAIVLASELAAALELDQLKLFFQPMVSLPGAVPQAVEAIVRWHHPSRGLLHPDEYGPVLVRSRVHARYVEWLLQRALEARSAWGDRDLPIAIDIAPQCVLDQGFPDQVAAALERAGLSGDQLILELSEAAALGTIGPLEKVLMTLRDRGVKVAIDDFGTSLNSVRRIRHVPATHLKIAPEFVRQVIHDDDAATVVRLAVETGRGYGLQVVAQGVQSEEQVAELIAHGCHVAQGRYVATLTASELRAYLQAAPTEEPTPDADVITLDHRRRARRVQN